MDPLQALEWQREHLEWLRTDDGLNYLRHFHMSATTSGSLISRTGQPRALTDRDTREGIKLRQSLVSHLEMGETFAVDEEMLDLVVYGADSLPDDRVEAWTPASTIGFAVFPRVVVFGTSENPSGRAPVKVRAFSWMTVGNQTRIAFYSSDEDVVSSYVDAGITDPQLLARLRSKMGRLSMAHWQTLQHGDHVREHLVHEFRDGAPVSDEDTAETERMIMTVLSFWHFCHQTVATAEPVTIPRHALKRWNRSGGGSNHVTRVVRLRRQSRPTADGEGREWSHRWIVRGHWRQQPYGPGRTLVRPVWIPAHVKGPEDAPLLDSTKVHHLVR